MPPTGVTAPAVARAEGLEVEMARNAFLAVNAGRSVKAVEVRTVESIVIVCSRLLSGVERENQDEWRVEWRIDDNGG